MGTNKNDMNTLVELYEQNKHTTDKWGVDKNTHSYLTVYDSIFKRLKDSSKRVLEIGVYKGDSLNLWAEYFTNATIYGIDKDYKQIDKASLHSNVQIFQRDAYTEYTIELLKEIGKFNVIIDDGSHRRTHQKYVIENYLNLLTDDGVLIIEDAVCWSPEVMKESRVGKLLRHFPRSLRKCVYSDDRRKIKNNANDYLIICDKGLCQK